MTNDDRTIREESVPPVSTGAAGLDRTLLQSGMIQPPPAPGLIGKVGRYEVLRMLGEGGMGHVLLAREPVTDSQVAIKMIRPEFLRKDWAVHRFLSEARHMFKLAHPAVVPVLEVSDRREGPYFVMPYMAGGSLATMIQTGEPLTARMILPVARSVAEALDFAHSRGVIHRDLKPSNILLDGDGRAFLADFGLLRTVFNDSMVDVTQPRLEGTVPYLSPAVAEGQAEDTRCDIYAFGCLLYEMLTGQPPYQGPTVEAVLRSILAGPPRPIREINPKASPALVRVAEGSMARELRDRYAAMSDVVADLTRIADRREPLGPHGAERSHHTHRALAWAGGVAAVGLLAWGLWDLVNRRSGQDGKPADGLATAATSSTSLAHQPAATPGGPDAPDGPPMPPGMVLAKSPALPPPGPPILPAALPQAAATGTTETLWMPMLATFSIGEGTASESQLIVVREPDGNTMRLLDGQHPPSGSESLAMDVFRGEACLRGRGSRAVLLEALRTSPAMTPTPRESGRTLLSLRFRRAPIEVMCRFVSESSDRTALCHPAILRTTLSCESPIKLTSAETELILTEALRHNGIAVSPLGSSLLAFHPTSMPSIASSGPLPLKWPPTIIPPSGSASITLVNVPVHEALRYYLVNMHPGEVSAETTSNLVEQVRRFGGSVSFESGKPLPWLEVAHGLERLMEWCGAEVRRDGTNGTVRLTAVPFLPPTPLPVAAPTTRAPAPAPLAPGALPPGVVRVPPSVTPSRSTRPLPPSPLPVSPEIVAEAERGAPDLLKIECVATFAMYRGSPHLYVRDSDGGGLRLLVPSALPTNVSVLAMDEGGGAVILGRGPRDTLRESLRACPEVPARGQMTKDGAGLVGFCLTNSPSATSRLPGSFSWLVAGDYMTAIAEWTGRGFLAPSRGVSSITGARSGRSLRDIPASEAVGILMTELEASGFEVETLGDASAAFLTVRSTNTPPLVATGAPKPRWPLPAAGGRPADRIIVSFSNEPIIEVVRFYLGMHDGQLPGRQLSNLLWQAETLLGSASGYTPPGGLPADLVACGVEHLLQWNGVEFLFEGTAPVAMRFALPIRTLTSRSRRGGVAEPATAPVPPPPGMAAPAAVPIAASPPPAPREAPGTVYSQNVVGYSTAPAMSGTVVRLTRSGDFDGAVVEDEQAVLRGVSLTVDSMDPRMLAWFRPAGGSFNDLLVRGRSVAVLSTDISDGCIETREFGQVPIAIRARSSGTNSCFVFALSLTAEHLDALRRMPAATNGPAMQ